MLAEFPRKFNLGGSLHRPYHAAPKHQVSGRQKKYPQQYLGLSVRRKHITEYLQLFSKPGLHLDFHRTKNQHFEHAKFGMFYLVIVQPEQYQRQKH